jgi:adenylate cyclase
MDRKLSAILAADVVGYSAQMERDEAGTFERLRAGRRELFEPEIARHQGRIFKLMGDGMLAEFGSVVDAVECAVSLQRGLSERNASFPEAEQIQVRIGINLGEVIVEGDDRYGDGVNIAARLEQLAEPGGICVSGKVATEVEKKLAFGFEPMGEQKVKNIAEPVRVYRVVLDTAAARKFIDANRKRRTWSVLAASGLVAIALGIAAAWWQPWKPATQAAVPTATVATDTRPSLVVLPFDNLSDDKEQAYLANGFTEDLTTALARVPGIFVVSRSAAFAYKDTDAKPAEIATALGVRYLLEGSVRRVGDEMRINAQLIDGSTSGHLWAERFDGKWSDVFKLQDQVVANIADTLKIRLANGAQETIAGGTSNPAAYDLYLRGLDIYYRNNSPEEFAQAVSYFKQAAELDSNFGLAFAQLAWTHWDADDARAKAMGSSYEKVSEKIPEFLALAARHPSSIYYQLVAELLVREHRSDEAVDVLLKAIALNPSDPWNYIGIAKALNFSGRPREALDYMDAALRVDPDPGWGEERYYLTGLAEFDQGRFEQAIGQFEKIDFLFSTEPWPKFYASQLLVSAYEHLGRTDQVAVALQKLKAILSERHEGEPNLLLTQDYLVFKNAVDAERLLNGLSRAGVPDLPETADLDPKDRLTEAEIKALIVGRNLRGHTTTPEVVPYSRISSNDGSISVTVGLRTDEGTSWVQGNFLCNAHPTYPTNCGAIFRNPYGKPELENEYKAVYRHRQFEFSVVN